MRLSSNFKYEMATYFHIPLPHLDGGERCQLVLYPRHLLPDLQGAVVLLQQQGLQLGLLTIFRKNEKAPVEPSPHFVKTYLECLPLVLFIVQHLGDQLRLLPPLGGQHVLHCLVALECAGYEDI